jgi:hypothetical protein
MQRYVMDAKDGPWAGLSEGDVLPHYSHLEGDSLSFGRWQFGHLRLHH